MSLKNDSFENAEKAIKDYIQITCTLSDQDEKHLYSSSADE